MRKGWISAAVLALGVLLFGSGIWMSGKAALAQVLLSYSWNEAKSQKMSKPPWPGMDARPLARLSVPSLGKAAIVFDNASGQALAFGPAFMTDTSPLGEPGVSAIAAHKNTHFAFLKDLRSGNEIEIETITGEKLTYTVTATEILDTDTQAFTIPEAASTSELALITCYPFDAISFGRPLRYIVRAELIQSKMTDVAAAETLGPDNGLVDSFIRQRNGQL